MYEVSDELHDAAVGVPVVQRGGCDGALDDVDNDVAAKQCDRTALDEPERNPFLHVWLLMMFPGGL